MTVTLPYSPLWEPLEWAKEHCPSYITNEIRYDDYNTYIDYHFADERDAALFILRWL